MQDEQRFSEIEFLPQQLSILRPTSQPAGKPQVRLAEGSHHGTRGTQTTEVQFGFTHGALESKQEPIIEIGGIVETVLIENQGVAETTDLQEPMPVATVAGQAGDFQPDHQPGVTHAHLGHEFLETLAICR